MSQNETQKMSRYVDLMVDLGFKRVFGSPANKDLMIALINSILPELHIQDITFLDKEKPGEWEEAKKSVFDVLCDTDTGSEVIVEVQIRPQDFYKDRTLYYIAQEILSQHGVGEEDLTLRPIYVISFMNFEMKHEIVSDQVTWNYSLRENDNGEKLSDVFNMTFVELSKFTKTENELENMRDKFYFCMNHLGSLKSRPESLEAEIFKKLFTRAEIAGMTVSERKQYQAKMNTEADIKNQIAYAVREAAREAAKEAAKEADAKGRAEGRAEGLAAANKATAQKMKQCGIDIATISKCTELSEEEIAKL